MLKTDSKVYKKKVRFLSVSFMVFGLCLSSVLAVYRSALIPYANVDHSLWLLETNAVDIAFPFLLCLYYYFAHEFQLDFMGEYCRKSFINSY